MLVAVIADPHYGVRKNKVIFKDALDRFLTRVFWPTIKSRGIRNIVCLGDVFDSQYAVQTTAMNDFMKFLDAADTHECELFITIGNHDCPFRNTIKPNAVSPLCAERPQVYVAEEPAFLDIEGMKWLMLPWVCEENVEQTMKLIRQAPDDVYVFGHLEIAGTPNGTGREYQEGFKRSTFKKFRRVMSGHIHHRSSIGNVDYIGTPYEQTWAEAGEPHGFAILDTETNTLEYIDNPETIHVVIDINWDGKDTELKDKVVKIIVPDDIKPSKRSKLLEKLQEKGMASTELVESFTVTETAEEQAAVQLTGNREMLLDYVEKHVTGPIDKTKLKDLLSKTYDKANERK